VATPSVRLTAAEQGDAMQSDQHHIVKPPRLKPGATVGIVAPAGPFEPKALDRGVAVLQEMGYAVRLAEGLFSKADYLAGDDTVRVAQLHEMFGDPSVDAVLCARGGFGALRLLPLLDFDLLASHPKALIGFSDITNLLNVIHLKTGMVTFHGPMACTLGKSDRQTRDSLQKALCGSEPVYIEVDDGMAVVKGKAEGRLMGGNLTTLCHLLGTPFSPSFKDGILFLEEIGEALYRIDRMLTHMVMSGSLEGVTGFVLGSFKNCGTTAEIVDLVERRLGHYEVPILAGLAAGHIDRNLTLPVGLAVRLDAGRKTLTFLTSATA